MELHTVWSVSRRCTCCSNSLSVLSAQSTAVQIRHRSVSIDQRLRQHLWTWSLHARYIGNLSTFNFVNSYFSRSFTIHTVAVNTVYMQHKFYPRDAMLAGVFAIRKSVRLSVPLSVRPSVRHEPILCQNEEMSWFFSPSGRPTILVFCCQISSNNLRFPRSGGLKQGWGGKIQPFSCFQHQYLENGSR